MTPEKFFTSKQQLARYHYAVEIAKKLQKYQNDGYMLFDSNEVIEGEIVYNTEFDKGDWSVIGVQYENCLCICIDIEYDDMGYPWICSKKSIRAAFEEFTMVHPKHIKKLAV